MGVDNGHLLALQGPGAPGLTQSQLNLTTSNILAPNMPMQGGGNYIPPQNFGAPLINTASILQPDPTQRNMSAFSENSEDIQKKSNVGAEEVPQNV